MRLGCFTRSVAVAVNALTTGHQALVAPVCTTTGYEKALDSQEKGQIKILSHAKVRL